MTVYVNGHRLNPLSGSARIAYAMDIEELLLQNSVGGIELYSSASRAPMEYQGLAGGCGVVLVWTRQRAKAA
jgi:hypothetical protein